MRRRAFCLLATLLPVLLLGVCGCSDGVSQGDETEPERSDPWGDFELSEVCGDGITVGAERCDSGDLAGMTCEAFGFERGTLRCKDNCAGFLVEGCAGVPTWADSAGPDETCDQCAADERCEEGVCVPSGPSTQLDHGVLRANLRRVTVRGQISVEGRPVSEFGDDRGLMMFAEEGAGDETGVYVGEDGRYEITLWAGEYRVAWRAPNSNPELPEGGVMLEREPIAIHSSGQLDYDLPRPVRLESTLAFEGGEPPAGAKVNLRPVGGEALGLPATSLEFSASSSSSSSTRIYPGRYGASLYSYHILGDEPALTDELVIRGDMQHDFTVPLSTIEGRLVVPEALRDEVQPVVRIYDDATSGTHAAPEIARDGRFLARVFPGHFRVNYEVRGRNFLYRPPSIEVDVEDEVHLEPALVGEVVPVSGTVRGLPAPQGDGGRGPRVRFESTDDEIIRAATLAEDGSFATRLPARTYEVYAYPDYDYRPYGNTDLRVPERQHRIFLGTVRAAGPTQLTLHASGPDAPAALPEPVRVRGVVTLLGETPGAVPSMSPGEVRPCYRGKLYFECVDGQSCDEPEPVDLPANGPARWETKLHPGVAYRVVYSPSYSSHATVEPCYEPPDARFGYVLHPRLVVDRAQRVDLDMKLARVDVAMTAHGAPLPKASDFGTDDIWSPAVRFARDLIRTRYESPDYTDLVLPGRYYAIPTFTPVDGSAVEPRAVTIEDDTTFEFDLPLHHAQVELTIDGEWSAPEGELGRVIVQSERGEFVYPVDAQGVAEVWWTGEDATFSFIPVRDHTWIHPQVSLDFE